MGQPQWIPTLEHRTFLHGFSARQTTWPVATFFAMACQFMRMFLVRRSGAKTAICHLTEFCRLVPFEMCGT